VPRKTAPVKKRPPPNEEEDREDEDSGERVAARKAPRPAAKRGREDEDDPDEEDEEDERPRRKGKKGKREEAEGSGKTVLFLAIGGGAVVLVGALVLLIVLLRPSKKGDDGKPGAPGGPGGTAAVNAPKFSVQFSLDAGPVGGVVEIALSPGGKKVVRSSEGSASNVRIFDLTTKQLTASIDAPVSERARDIAISPDSRLLAVCETDLQLRDLNTGAVVRTLRKETKPGELELRPRRVAFSPKGDLVVAAGNGELVGWAPDTGKQLFAFEAHGGGIYHLRFLSDGKLVTCGGDNTIKVFDLPNTQPISRIQTARIPEGVAVTADGKKVAGEISFDAVYIWDLGTGAVLKKLSTPESRFAKRALFLPDNKTLLMYERVGNDKGCLYWDVEVGSAPTTWNNADLAGLFIMTLSKDGQTLVTAHKSGQIKVWAAQR
jgi:WD40 repeat protein